MFKRLVSIAGISLLFAGCAAPTYQLSKTSSPEFVRGEFNYDQPSRLVIETGTKRYLAEGFVVTRHENMNELRRAYRGSDPKHWDRIFAGHDKDHQTYSAEPKALSADGAELTCRLAWPRGGKARGSCNDSNGKDYLLNFE